MPDLLPYFNGTRGAQVISTFEGFVGPVEFERRMQQYLARHRHGEATTDDMAAALGSVRSESLGPALWEALSTTESPEFRLEAACSSNALVFSVIPHSKTSLAHIPLCVAYEDGGRRREVCKITRPNTAFTIAVSSCPSWVVPNPGGTGLYRFTWNAADVMAIVERGWSSLSVWERDVLLGDLSSSRRLANTTLLQVALRLVDGSDAGSSEWARAVMWSHASFVPEDLRPAYDARLRRILGPVVRPIHFQDAGLDRKKARVNGEVLDLVAGTSEPLLQKEARSMGPRYLDTQAEYLSAAVQLIADSSDAEMLRLLRDVPRVEPELRPRVLAGLARARALVSVLTKNRTVIEALSTTDRMQLLAGGCHPRDRSAAEALAKTTLSDNAYREVAIAIEECVARTAEDDPTYRAWLAQP